MYIDRLDCYRPVDERPAVDFALAAGYLPSFEGIVAVTPNDCAVMTTMGIYRGVHLERRVHAERRGLHLYFHGRTRTDAVLSPVDHAKKTPPGIMFQDNAGQDLHRTYLTTASDAVALDGLRRSIRSFRQPATVAEIGALPADSPSRTVDRQVIPHLLTYLAALRLPLVIGLSNRECTHTDDGAIDDVRRTGDLLFVHSGETILSYDPALISCWRIRQSTGVRDMFVLEAASSGGRGRLIFMPGHDDSGRAASSWNTILASIP